MPTANAKSEPVDEWKLAHYLYRGKIMTDQTANGNCFEVAIHIALRQVLCDDPDAVRQGLSYLEQLDGTDVHVVHGLVQHPYEAFMHPHGWVEFKIGDTVMCLDCANGNRCILPQDAYYRIGKIDDPIRYTEQQALNMIMEHETYGPWEVEYE